MVGLSAGAVGIAIMLAMMVESFVDPAVGFLSDRTRGRWGRRHPWMYASAIPVAIGWLLLWNPPSGWSQTGLLFYLFGSALLVRVALSMFEIPASALGPELSSDYDERTRLFSYRYLFAWIGGLGMLSLAYAVFLVPDAAHPVGLQNGPGYSRMATVAAIAMAVAILVSSLGLHPEIKHLPKAPPADAIKADSAGTFRQTISNKAFVTLLVAGIFAYTGQGVSFALSNYMYQYVWLFRGGDYQWLSLALLVGVVIASVIAPRLSRGGDKARIGTMLSIGNALLVVSPYVLRLLGFFPAPGSALALPLLLAIFVANTACGVAAFILGASMLSDVVEESELRTGRRSEGVFLRGQLLRSKDGRRARHLHGRRAPRHRAIPRVCDPRQGADRDGRSADLDLHHPDADQLRPCRVLLFALSVLAVPSTRRGCRDWASRRTDRWGAGRWCADRRRRDRRADPDEFARDPARAARPPIFARRVDRRSDAAIGIGAVGQGHDDTLPFLVDRAGAEEQWRPVVEARDFRCLDERRRAQRQEGNPAGRQVGDGAARAAGGKAGAALPDADRRNAG